MSTLCSQIHTPISPAFLLGAVEIEQTPRGLMPHRLPAWARTQCADPQLAMVESQPSGVRLAFRTSATAIELDVLPTRYAYVGAPQRPAGIYDLLINDQLTRQCSATSADLVLIDMATGNRTKQAGSINHLRFYDLPAGNKKIEIWLPHNETTELIALRADAALAPVNTASRKRWLHHGSSISHGSNAESPSRIWPALVANQNKVDLLNLGLGGSALLDPFTARTLRDLPADFISLKIGINLVNSDLMRLRAFTPAVHGFIDTLRDGHPDTPLLVISPIYCPIHEDTPGPGAFDLAALAEGKVIFTATGRSAETRAGKLTLRIIRDELHRIVQQRAASDRNLHYLNGLDLFGPEDFAEFPLPDHLHPDGAGHQRIAQRFAERAFGNDGVFSV